MAEKNSFVFYNEWAEQVAIIADAEGGAGVTLLFSAIHEYLADGETSMEMSPVVRLVFNQIRAQLDRDKAKYKKVSSQRSDAANARWQKADAEVCETMRNDANECETMREDAYIRSKDKRSKVDDKGVEEDDNESPIGDNSLSVIGPALPAPQFAPESDPHKLTDKGLEQEFEALWILYPRKAGKADALRHYKAARKNGTSYDEVEQGIIRYTRHIEDEKTDPQYIAMGSTWFCGHRWEDVYARHGPKPGSLEWIAQL